VTTAIEQDERTDQFYRPAAPSKPHALRPREMNAGRNAPRARPDSPEPAEAEEGREQEPFLRSRRRVPIRRGIVPKTRTGRILFALTVVLALALLVVLALSVRNFLRDDPRFRINSASSIQVVGNSEVTRAELLSVFGSDIGRNIFFVPLRERRAELEQLPWVAHATVMRLLPDQLRVSIVERVPVAFLRNGNTIGLVDENGVPLNMTPATMAAKHYSFPVVTGITARDPLPVRAARMRLYQQFITALDSSGTKVSDKLSEVDLSDPEDIRVLMPTPGSAILVHFGQGDFLERYQRYQQHLAEWLRDYPHLASVDLRYDGQVVLEMAKGSYGTPGADFGPANVTPGHSTAKTKPQPERGKNSGAVASHTLSRAQIHAKARPRTAPKTTLKTGNHAAVRGNPLSTARASVTEPGRKQAPHQNANSLRSRG
jgi:cell division protein FtsQ